MDDFLCEQQSDELIPEYFGEELDDLVETTEQVKPHSVSSDWAIATDLIF